MVLHGAHSGEATLPTAEEGTEDQADEVRAEEGRPPSPFIGGTSIQWAWDSTSLGAFKKCPRFYQYKIIEGWQPNGEGIHLRWGREFHSALEDYEHSKVAGVKHDDAVHDTLRALLCRIEDWDPDPRTKTEELKTKANLVRSVVWYLDHYENDAAKTVVLPSGKPATEVSFRFELDYGPQQTELYPVTLEELEKTGDPNKTLQHQNYYLCGHLDKIVEFSGDKYVMDHKTLSSTPSSSYFDSFDLDNQMSLYTLAGQIILNSPVKGVIIDAIQVAVGFSRCTRGFTYRTPDQLEEWMETTKHWLREAERCAEADSWPMKDTSCNMYGGCEFREVCSKSPQVRSKWLEAKFKKEEPWNPLKPR